MRKLGHIYCPTGEWTHASTPTFQYLGGDFYRVYFSSRDPKNRSHVFSLDIDINKPTRYENVRGPLLGPGRKGTFDDCGVSVACVKFPEIYYLGWSLTKTSPFHNALGVARIEKDSVIRFMESPVMDRSPADPISLAYPWVDGGDMYYSSNISWGESDQDMAYVLKRATFLMKFGWCEHTEILSLKDGEKAIVRPCVRDKKMWYAIKKDRYTIGNARQEANGIWTRVDDCPLKPSEGFDSEEVTYPCVFDHKGKLYMLYNGNSYGKTGFGIAVSD